MNICISRDGVEIGEWSEEQVRAFYQEGRLVGTDSYWIGGMTEWGNLSAFINPPPPFPSASKIALPSVPLSTSVTPSKRRIYPSTPPTRGDFLIPIGAALICGTSLVAYEQVHTHGGLTTDPFILVVSGFARALASLVLGVLVSLTVRRPARLLISVGVIVALAIFGATQVAGEKAFHPMSAEQWKADQDKIRADTIRQVLQQDLHPASAPATNN